MKNSQILDHFFEEQHRQWKKEVYTVFQSSRKDYGFLLKQNHSPNKNKSIDHPIKKKNNDKES